MGKAQFIPIAIIVISIILVGCSFGPSEEEIAAIVEAQVETRLAAVMTETAVAAPSDTLTPEPTDTPEATATFTPQPCFMQAVDYLSEVDIVIEEWDDAVAVADSTARVSLSDPIATLQELKRDAASLEEPDCAMSLSINEMLVAHMEHSIEGYLSFASDDSDDVVTYHFLLAKVAQDVFFDGLSALEQGETELPGRIHYLVLGRLSKGIHYLDENERQQAAEFGVVGPWLTSIMPTEGSRLSVDVNQTVDRELYLACTIYRNGQILVDKNNDGETSTIRCDFPE